MFYAYLCGFFCFFFVAGSSNSTGCLATSVMMTTHGDETQNLIWTLPQNFDFQGQKLWKSKLSDTKII